MMLTIAEPSEVRHKLNSGPVFMTVGEVSKALGLSHSQVCRLINEQVFTVELFGGRTRYVTAASVAAWLKQFVKEDDDTAPAQKTNSFPEAECKASPLRPPATKFDIPSDMRAHAKRIAVLANEKVISVDDLNSLIRSLMAWAFHVDELLQRWQAKGLADMRRDAAVEHARVSVTKQLVAESLDANFDPHGMFVYILWGDDNQTPVYVGQSTNVLNRLGSHLGDREKRSLVRRIQLIRCRTHNEMNNTELRLIREFRPLLNKAGLDNPAPGLPGATNTKKENDR